MSDAMNPAELHGQHVELLPARIVLSMFSVEGAGGGTGGDGSSGMGKIGIKVLGMSIPPDGGNGFGTPGMSQDG